MQQRSFAQASGFSDSEYEILMDIALRMTDRAISDRRHLSLRSVQNRLQQIYSMLEVLQASAPPNVAAFNLRARAVTVAMLRKLLNYGALEKAEAELQHWLRGH